MQSKAELFSKGEGVLKYVEVLENNSNAALCQNWNFLGEGGVEPPRISPHAPQACASAIPPPALNKPILSVYLADRSSALAIHCSDTLNEPLLDGVFVTLGYSALFSELKQPQQHIELPHYSNLFE